MAKSSVVRYGLISTARIGFTAHVPAAKLSTKSQIVAVSSRDKKKAEAAAKEHGIPVAFGSYEEMLASPEIDAVINTLPNSMHHEWTIKAAEAGKHILCEKPLSVTMKEAREMAAAAKANNVVLVEAFTPRWNPQMKATRELIAAGEIGEVTSLEAGLTFMVTDPSNIRLSKPLAGGSLMDAGCYAVYAVRFAMGKEPTQAAAFDRKRKGIEVDTTFNGFLKFPGDAVAHVFSSVEGPRQRVFTAIGTKGQISIPDAFSETSPVIIKRESGEEVREMKGPNRFQVQLDEFSECVLTGKKPVFPVEDAMRNMAAVIALLDSAAKGRAVPVEKV
jgi:predicted dehydrogenase